MIIRLLITLILLTQLSYAADNCKTISDKADSEGILIDSNRSGYKVVEKSRLYFYKSPNENCRETIFIVNGDYVDSYLEYNGFMYIMYFSRDENVFTGWVKSSGLTPTGLGVGAPKSNNR